MRMASSDKNIILNIQTIQPSFANSISLIKTYQLSRLNLQKKVVVQKSRNYAIMIELSTQTPKQQNIFITQQILMQSMSVSTSDVDTPLQYPLIFSYSMLMPFVQPIFSTQGTSAQLVQTTCFIIYFVQEGISTTSFCLCPILQEFEFPNTKDSNKSCLLTSVKAFGKTFVDILGSPIWLLPTRVSEAILPIQTPLSQPLSLFQDLQYSFYLLSSISFLIGRIPLLLMMTLSIVYGTTLKSLGNWYLSSKAKTRGILAIFSLSPVKYPLFVLRLSPTAQLELAQAILHYPMPSKINLYRVYCECFGFLQARISPEMVFVIQSSLILIPQTYCFQGQKLTCLFDSWLSFILMVFLQS